MVAFYFDVGGVLIPDKLAPDNALNAFRHLAERHSFNPDDAHATYAKLQPLLDLGRISLADLCVALGVNQKAFERDWLAMHPVDRAVVHIIERLLADGHSVGLATNFCRRLLDLLVESVPALSRLSVCCSSDIGLVKPSTGFFSRASEIMDAQEIVFIDDRNLNVQAARSFGWTAIHATQGWLHQFKEVYIS